MYRVGHLAGNIQGILVHINPHTLKYFNIGFINCLNNFFSKNLSHSRCSLKHYTSCAEESQGGSVGQQNRGGSFVKCIRCTREEQSMAYIMATYWTGSTKPKAWGRNDFICPTSKYSLTKTCLVALAKFNEPGYKLLTRRPYYLDLAPSYYFLFPTWKSCLTRKDLAPTLYPSLKQIPRQILLFLKSKNVRRNLWSSQGNKTFFQIKILLIIQSTSFDLIIRLFTL